MKDGEYIEYHEGKIYYRCNYLKGKLNGEYIDYYTSGDISYKCNYLDGNLYGEYITYFRGGEVSSKNFYINTYKVTDQEWSSYNRNIKLESIL
jgi:antitoxin component YwqK of YwqJK toxin-antitoxin module